MPSGNISDATSVFSSNSLLVKLFNSETLQILSLCNCAERDRQLCSTFGEIAVFS